MEGPTQDIEKHEQLDAPHESEDGKTSTQGNLTKMVNTELTQTQVFRPTLSARTTAAGMDRHGKNSVSTNDARVTSIAFSVVRARTTDGT